MKKYIKFKASSFWYGLLKKKVEKKLTALNDMGYQTESVKYTKNKWLIAKAECVLFKLGKQCVCACHNSNESIIHCRPCCENGYIFE